MTDNQSNGSEADGSDDNNEAPAPTLDSLTDETQAQFDQEDAEAKAKDNQSDDEDESDDDDQADDDTEDKSDDKDESDDEDESEEDGSDDQSDEDEAEDEKSKDQPTSKQVTVPEVDNDISKDGDYKVKFIDADDKEFFVHNADELPDDFQPRSYKEYASAVQKLPLVQAKFESDKSKAEADKAKSDDQQRQLELANSWKADIERLSQAGQLPKDKAKLEKEASKVFDFMASEMKKNVESNGKEGAIIDNFAVAHELMVAREAKADKDKQQQQIVDNKKKRGAMVGSGGNNNVTGPISAPKMGTTLDDLHEQVVGSL